MLIWPVLALLLVLLFYKRDVTPPWNPPLPPQPWPPQPPQGFPQAPQPPPQADTAPTRQSTSGFSGTFTPPPPVDLNDVFRRPRS
jgi:hypothetical protein